MHQTFPENQWSRTSDRWNFQALKYSVYELYILYQPSLPSRVIQLHWLHKCPWTSDEFIVM